MKRNPFNPADQANQWRQQQEHQGGEHARNPAPRAAAPRRFSNTQIALLLTAIVITGLLVHEFSPAVHQAMNRKPPQADPKKQAVLKFNGASSVSAEHKSCTLYDAFNKMPKHPQTTLRRKNYEEPDLRKMLGDKIAMHSSVTAEFAKFFDDRQFDPWGVREALIDYFVNRCDEHLISILSTYTHIEISPKSMATHLGRYNSMTNTLHIYIPLWTPIVSTPNNAYPYNEIVRTIRHEHAHARMAEKNSHQDCKPSVIADEMLAAHRHATQANTSASPSRPRSPGKLREAIAMGDQRIKEKIGGLLQKMQKNGFKGLTKSAQGQYRRWQEKFKHYIPRRGIVILDVDKKTLADFKKQIQAGVPVTYIVPGRSFPIYIDEIHYEYYSIMKSKQIVATGYLVPKRDDIFEAIMLDVKWKQEHVPDIYKAKIAEDSAQIAELASEEDAATWEMGQEILEEFYPEFLAEHARLAQNSACQPDRLRYK